MTTTEIDTCPTIEQLLRPPRRIRTPGGRALNAQRHGRMFIWIDLDDWVWPTPPFVDGTTEIMAPMADHLATIYANRRDASAWLSGWDRTGYLYAPTRAADVLLRVMWDVDGGKLDTARMVAPVIAQACHDVEHAGNRTARSLAARTIVTRLEDELIDLEVTL